MAIDPDTGNGPTVLVVIDSGKLMNLGDEDLAPYFLGAVGDSERTCTVRMKWEECPAAVTVYELLKQQSLPIGFEMDNPAEIPVIHAPTYYLEFSDGQGNHNQWRFYGGRHPLQDVIDNSIEQLRQCWGPAEQAYKAF